MPGIFTKQFFNMNLSLWKILKYGRYTGYFPFKFSVFMNEIELRLSLPFSIHSGLILSLLVLLGLLSDDSDFPKIVQIACQIENVYVIILYVLVSLLKRKDLECFINKVQKVGDLLGSESEESIYSYVDFVVFFLTPSFLLLNFILSYDYEDPKLLTRFNSFVLSSMGYCLDVANILNYKRCVILIRNKIIQIQTSLMPIFLAIEKQESTKMSKTKEKKVPKNNQDTSDLYNILNAYRTLFEATEALNNFYNLSILISSTVCMAQIVVSPFLLYVFVTESSENLEFIASIGWLLGGLLKGLVIIEPCHACQSQGKDLAQLLARLSRNTSSKHADMLRKFHNVMEESPIEFHMGGIAKISRSLYPAVLSGPVTTYLIILFQVKKAIL